MKQEEQLKRNHDGGKQMHYAVTIVLYFSEEFKK